MKKYVLARGASGRLYIASRVERYKADVIKCFDEENNIISSFYKDICLVEQTTRPYVGCAILFESNLLEDVERAAFYEFL